AEELRTRSFLDLVCPPARTKMRAGLKRAAQGKNLTNFEIQCCHKDGSNRWISWNTSTEDHMIYAYGRDITAEKKAGEALHRSRARLREIFESSYQYQGLLTL